MVETDQTINLTNTFK